MDTKSRNRSTHSRKTIENQKGFRVEKAKSPSQEKKKSSILHLRPNKKSISCKSCIFYFFPFWWQDGNKFSETFQGKKKYKNIDIPQIQLSSNEKKMIRNLTSLQKNLF